MVRYSCRGTRTVSKYGIISEPTALAAEPIRLIPSSRTLIEKFSLSESRALFIRSPRYGTNFSSRFSQKVSRA
jgi:hypothetical protein